MVTGRFNPWRVAIDQQYQPSSGGSAPSFTPEAASVAVQQAQSGAGQAAMQSGSTTGISAPAESDPYAGGYRPGFFGGSTMGTTLTHPMQLFRALDMDPGAMAAIRALTYEDKQRLGDIYNQLFLMRSLKDQLAGSPAAGTVLGALEPLFKGIKNARGDIVSELLGPMLTASDRGYANLGLGKEHGPPQFYDPNYQKPGAVPPVGAAPPSRSTGTTRGTRGGFGDVPPYTGPPLPYEGNTGPYVPPYVPPPVHRNTRTVPPPYADPNYTPYPYGGDALYPKPYKSQLRVGL